MNWNNGETMKELDSKNNTGSSTVLYNISLEPISWCQVTHIYWQQGLTSTMRLRWTVMSVDCGEAHADSVSPSASFSFRTFLRNNITRWNMNITYITIIITIIMIIIIAFKGAIRDFLQSPHCAANRLQHIHSSGPGAFVCKSRATHGALITCNMSCYMPRGTKGQLSYYTWLSLNHIYFSYILLTEPLTNKVSQAEVLLLLLLLCSQPYLWGSPF